MDAVNVSMDAVNVNVSEYGCTECEYMQGM